MSLLRILKICCLVGLLAACGSAPRKATHVQPNRPVPVPEQIRELVEAERLYRGADPAFAEARDRLSADPATAYRLAQMLVRDLVFFHDNRDVDDEVFLSEATKFSNPKAVTALEHLRAMGAAATTCIREELLMHRYADRRAIGVMAVLGMDQEAAASLLPMLEHREARVRRTGLEALAGMESDERVQRAVRASVRDPDFTVRAAAYGAASRTLEEPAPVLRDGLEQEGDPFVRLAIVSAMTACRDRRSAELVIDYLATSLAKGDGQGALSARKVLRQMSGLDHGANIASWRTWARGLPER